MASGIFSLVCSFLPHPPATKLRRVSSCILMRSAVDPRFFFFPPSGPLSSLSVFSKVGGSGFTKTFGPPTCPYSVLLNPFRTLSPGSFLHNFPQPPPGCPTHGSPSDGFLVRPQTGFAALFFCRLAGSGLPLFFILLCGRCHGPERVSGPMRLLNPSKFLLDF